MRELREINQKKQTKEAYKIETQQNPQEEEKPAEDSQQKR